MAASSGQAGEVLSKMTQPYLDGSNQLPVAAVSVFTCQFAFLEQCDEVVLEPDSLNSHLTPSTLLRVIDDAHTPAIAVTAPNTSTAGQHTQMQKRALTDTRQCDFACEYNCACRCQQDALLMLHS